MPGKQRSDLKRGPHFKMQWINSILSVKAEVESAARKSQPGGVTGADPLALERGLAPPLVLFPSNHSAQRAQLSSLEEG